MRNNKKMTTLILVMVLGIFLILGGTFAYWQWMTDESQQTLVNVSLKDDAKMYIDFPSETLTGLYPTSDCDPRGTSSWVTSITVDNDTGVLLSPQFKLKLKIEDNNNNIITNTVSEIENLYKNDHPNRYYIKYAITSENGSCDKPLFAGRFDQDTKTFPGLEVKQPGDAGYEEYIEKAGWYDSTLITKFDEETHFPIVSGRVDSGVSFYAEPNVQTTQKFKVWIWLSNEYTSVTSGTESTDMMQDAKVTVSWSENSELLQVKKAEKTGEAVAIYSADDNSLRFYRDTTANLNALEVGDEYNKRVITRMYRDVEDNFGSIYGMGISAWNTPKGVDNIYPEIVVFEDYIYPTNIRSWFSYVKPTIPLDVTKLVVSDVTNMSMAFMGFDGKVLGLENWDTSNVTSMTAMFYEVSSTIVDNPIVIENFDTSNVTNMSLMFYASSLELDLTGWNVCNVTNYENFKIDAPNITEPYFGTSKCRGVKGEAIAIYSETDNSLRFYRDENPDNIIVGESYKGRVVTRMYRNVEDNFGSIHGMGISAWNTPKGVDNIYPEIVVFEDYIYPTNIRSWFSYMKLTAPLDVTKLDVSNVTNMELTFFGFDGKVLGLETWDTSNVTDMGAMFYEVSSTAIDNSIVIENWDTSNVTDMGSMFYASSLELDLRGWNVCNVASYDNFKINAPNITEPNFSDLTKCNGGLPA